MIAAPFSAAAGFFTFYALQPYLLDLYGNPEAYGIAGIAAAMVAGAQIGGGLLVPQVRKLFKKRTSVLMLGFLDMLAITVHLPNDQRHCLAPP